MFYVAELGFIERGSHMVYNPTRLANFEPSALILFCEGKMLNTTTLIKNTSFSNYKWQMGIVRA